MRAYNADISATRDPPLCWAQWWNNDVPEQGHLDVTQEHAMLPLCRHCSDILLSGLGWEVPLTGSVW